MANQYLCKECGARAFKAPVAGHYDIKAHEWVGGGLGKFRCPTHGPVAVRRTKADEPKEKPIQ
jgi:predicted RNA-binding Zn-ribbon protein involved in translation (DUF1610 family)